MVDDFSQDESNALLSAYANENSRLDYLPASQDIKGKKQALIDGLTQVKLKWVLLTDADCNPASDQWAESMLRAAEPNGMVLGFSPYERRNGFLNRWIRYEAVLTAIQYFSFSLVGKTYMGVGRNLLYAKSLVKEGEVLKESINIASGDDDLLVNKLATKDNVSIQLDPESWVYSEPKESWNSYFNQKRRHMSTASSYQFSHQFYLLSFSVSWIALYFCIIGLFLLGLIKLAVGLLLFRLITTYFSVAKLFTKLGLKDSIAHWWYLDPFTAFYFLFFSIFAILPQKEAW